MGCCFSSRDRNHDADHRSSIDGAPPTSPPGVLEEETVKEVLLETPLVPKNDDLIKAIPPDSGPPVANHAISDALGKEKEEIVSEVSELSEMCSYSESYSNATAQERKDDEEDGVVNQRPPPRKRRAGRGRGVARRMAAPTPERRRQVAPLRAGRGRGMPRNVAEENARRRDAGEGSGRRSRSPVRREEADAQRKAGGGEKIPAPAREPPNDVVPAEEAESLENPVVSLECFIFL